jgi:hypothetical protein
LESSDACPPQAGVMSDEILIQKYSLLILVVPFASCHLPLAY